MDALLNSLAVGQKKGDDASHILQAYIQTGPAMALSHTPAPQAVAAKPRGAAADSIDPTK